MRIIMESLFDVAYLVVGFLLGLRMIRMSKGDQKHTLFGWMTMLLVFGDSFHLVPRIIGLCTTGLQDYTAALGIGKLVTSVTMTIFYMILYLFWKLHTRTQTKPALDYVIYGLAAVRILLCLLPQNQWLSAEPPVLWGVLRNIPFVILGAIIVFLFAKTGKNDRFFRFMPLAVVLSFAFYIPVVLWAHVSPMIGMLMLPKTCMYVWIMIMGYRSAKA